MCADFHSTSMELLVENLVERVLENSSKDRIMVGRLLSQMLVKHVLLRKQYQTGLRNFLANAGDFIVDVPLYWTCMGEIIGKIVFCFLKAALQEHPNIERSFTLPPPHSRLLFKN